jgi:hypothetical protein
MLRTTDNLHTLIDSFANPAKPVTLCTLSADAGSPKFISATEIGYATSNVTPDTVGTVSEIQRMSLIDKHPVSVATVAGQVMDVAWSPDGSNVAYLVDTSTPDGSTGNQLWLKKGSSDPKALTPLIPQFGRDVSVDDETIVRFSTDGQYVAMVDTFVAGPAPALAKLAAFQVLSVQDGGLVWVPTGALGAAGKYGGWVTMAAWLHGSDRLFYRDTAGVHTWEPPTAVRTFAAGLEWRSPSLSRDDRIVAYSAASTTGKPHIELRNLASGSVRVLSGTLDLPILLSDAVMLEWHMVANTQGPGPPYYPSRLYALNLSTNVETPVPGILMTLDSWPR